MSNVIGVVISVLSSGVISLISSFIICKYELMNRSKVEKKYECNVEIVEKMGSLCYYIDMLIQCQDFRKVVNILEDIKSLEYILQVKCMFIDKELKSNSEKVIKKLKKMIKLVDTELGIKLKNTENGIWCGNRLYRNEEYVIKDIVRCKNNIKKLKENFEDSCKKILE